jgi:FdhD protein
MSSAPDLVVGEEPLEIRVNYFDGIARREKRLAVTMRTPGHDFELCTGFLITEGILDGYGQVKKIFYCEEVSEEEADNVVIVQLHETVSIDASIFNRNFYINSSCGVCGKSSLESVSTICDTSLDPSGPSIPAALIHRIPAIVGSDQSVFKHTGGLHASALFDATGKLLLIREDIGRHNALDKLIGARVIKGQDNSGTICFVSGRAGFELVQKTIVAGIPAMVAVGAPSSLAVDLASEYGQTLIGFARDGKFNIYSGKQRIV